jgi:hypothetical protein
VERPAESVAPAHRTWLALAGDVQASRRIRRPQLQRPVRTMGVVVGGIDPEDLLEMAAPTISSQSKHSARIVPIYRSA